MYNFPHLFPFWRIGDGSGNQGIFIGPVGPHHRPIAARGQCFQKAEGFHSAASVKLFLRQPQENVEVCKQNDNGTVYQTVRNRCEQLSPPKFHSWLVTQRFHELVFQKLLDASVLRIDAPHDLVNVQPVGDAMVTVLCAWRNGADCEASTHTEPELQSSTLACRIDFAHCAPSFCRVPGFQFGVC